MEDSSKLLFAYWQCRGRAQAIRYLLEYLQFPYEEKRYDGENWQEWFEKDKPSLPNPFPNLPYIKHQGKVITETETIFLYIIRKSGRKDLLGKTEDDEFTVSTSRWALKDLVDELGKLAYNPEYEKVRDETLETNIGPRLETFSKFLGEKEYLHGYITYVDFIFFEMLEILEAMKNELFSKYENLKEYHRKFKEQKFMKDYMASERFIRRPFFGLSTWNPME